MANLRKIHEVFARDLATKSALFEAGPLDPGISDEQFILRLNTLLAAHSVRHRRVPADLSEALLAKGSIKPLAELVIFGRWLLIDGQPGMVRSKYPSGFPRILLRCVAAGMHELHMQTLRRNAGKSGPGRSSRKRGVTKHDLARQWRKLYGEEKCASFFDAKLRSMRRILEGYEAYLRSGKAALNGQKIKRSPILGDVLIAISPTEAVAAKPTPPSAAPSSVLTPQAPQRFSIALEYSTAAQREDYRDLSGVSLPQSSLCYTPRDRTVHNGGSDTSKSDANVQVFAPEVDIRRDYRATALIDRLGLLLDTCFPMPAKELQTHLSRQAGSICFVQDLTMETNGDWGRPLPVPDMSKKTGYHFAIMVQEPTPTRLQQLLEALHPNPGIASDVSLHLVEVAVDFYAQGSSPEEALLQRERMVGLLQRHHWAEHKAFLRQKLTNPRQSDPRYTTVASTKHLFSGKTTRSDRETTEESVRERLLTAEAGKSIPLDATLYNGAREGPALVRIQHKIADRRNPGNDTLTSLARNQRRARIEVVLSGTDELAGRDLKTVEDLATVSFRKLTRPYLAFSLPEAEAFKERQEDLQRQMQSRGVYGVELRNRAREEEMRATHKKAGKRLQRRSERKAFGLQPWHEMNEMTGRALDELKRRWKGYKPS